MREIKFRARHKESGTWDYGSSETKLEDAYSVPLRTFWEWVQVGKLDPETVGEFIGRKDKNGKEIYEGDRVVWEAISKALQKEVYIIQYEAPIGVVEWSEEDACFQLKQITPGLRIYNDPKSPNEGKYNEPFYGYQGQEFSWKELEVIGNI